MKVKRNETALTEFPQNKAQLIACIHQSWNALTQAIAGRDLDCPGPGGWTIKDHLAHITEWERFILRNQFQGLSPDEALQMAQVELVPFDVDRVNALIFERNHNRSSEDVLADFHRVHAQLLATVEVASESDLVKATCIFGDEVNSILIWVLYNTCDHYDEHLQTIREISLS